MKIRKQYDITMSRDVSSDIGRSKLISSSKWLDRYELISRQGGNNSEVYLIKHRKLGEYRIVKCVSKRKDQAWQIQEAFLLRNLKHPRIPLLYDVEEDDEKFYIVEEYVEGESLEQLMKYSTTNSLDYIMQIIKELLEVFHYLHSQKPYAVIYQDLKADHVRITATGVKLIDFGIARYENQVQSSVNYGTPKYCPPEKSRQGKVTMASDIYSIGKLMEELIAWNGTKEALRLLEIAGKAQNEDVTKRYPSVQSLYEAVLLLEKEEKIKRKYQKHLLKRIIITGSEHRVGCTHIAMALCTYLNYSGIKSVYSEQNTSNHLRKLIEQEKGFSMEQGIYCRGDFLGIPNYGSGVEVDVPENMLEVADYGNSEPRAGDADELRVLVVGLKPWEWENSKEHILRLSREQDIVIANGAENCQVKRMAQETGRIIYLFPYDVNPFRLSKEKQKVLGGLLHKGGVGKEYNYKNRCNCRERNWLWSNRFSCLSGKLCSFWSGGGHSVS